MATIHELFSEYAESHQNKTNQLLHWICIPLIYWSLVALVIYSRFILNLPTSIVLTLPILWYYSKSKSITIGMITFTLICLIISFFIAKVSTDLLLKSALIIFVLAWIGQFIGHKIEGKKPSFLRDLVFLLVGPAWLLSKIYNKAGFKY